MISASAQTNVLAYCWPAGFTPFSLFSHAFSSLIHLEPSPFLPLLPTKHICQKLHFLHWFQFSHIPDLVSLITLTRWFQSYMVSPVGSPEILLQKAPQCSLWNLVISWIPPPELPVWFVHPSWSYLQLLSVSYSVSKHVQPFLMSGSVVCQFALSAKPQARV